MLVERLAILEVTPRVFLGRGWIRGCRHLLQFQGDVVIMKNLLVFGVGGGIMFLMEENASLALLLSELELNPRPVLSPAPRA